MPLVYMFPGQGSQKKGMGKEVFEKYPDLVERASQILNEDIVSLCHEESDMRLDQTQYTQPALYTVNALSFLAKKEESGEADFYIGHSLGEYNALFAAGVFDFETGLKLVKQRGELMASQQGGGMAAVIGMEEDKINGSLESASLADKIDIANYNSPGQIVISGRKADIESAKAALEESGARMVVPLNVSGAFHSRYMKEAAGEFRNFLNDFTFNPAEKPVIANATAKRYEASQDSIADTLAKQIHSSVRWIETVELLLNEGVDDWQEVGPGNVLSGLLKRIKAKRK